MLSLCLLKMINCDTEVLFIGLCSVALMHNKLTFEGLFIYYYNKKRDDCVRLLSYQLKNNMLAEASGCLRFKFGASINSTKTKLDGFS